jgi:hypothetical protein
MPVGPLLVVISELQEPGKLGTGGKVCALMQKQ